MVDSKKFQRKYDAIVVGSGPGGASVARGLAKAGKQVLIVERAADRPVNGGFRNAVSEFLKPGTGMVPVNDVAVVRGVAVGGSSIYYHGTAVKPPYEMFDKHGVDLRPAVDEIYREIPINRLPDELMGPGANRIMESARDLGLPWEKLEKFVDLDECTPNQWLPYFLAPTYKSKWNGRLWIEEAVSLGAELLTETSVTGVNIEGNVACGVTAVHDGCEYKVESDLVVLAAGGMASPVILQNSGIEAGRDWFHDPLINVTASFSDLRTKNEFAMSGGVIFKDEGVVMSDIRGPQSLYMLNALVTKSFTSLFSYHKTAQIMVKIRDDLTGSISREGRLNKPLTNDDRDRLTWGVDKARKIFKNAGAVAMRDSKIAAAHPGGTAKIGEVVDSNLKTSADGLYVCDASVIPEPFGLPPTMTVIALGKYLVERLTDPVTQSG